MYRTCKCEDFPCCGHGFIEPLFPTDYLDEFRDFDDYDYSQDCEDDE